MTRTDNQALVSSHRKALRFGQIGAFKQASDRDVARSVSALGLIAVHDKDFLRGRDISNDVVNLAHGRDFLDEARVYDVVIVHSILSPKIRMFKAFPRLRVSPLHSITKWRKRLASTRARYLAIWETDPATLSGKELGEIPGYQIIAKDAFLTLYAKAVRG